jgi:MinD-like ATPase involved in chromosome partitioning or flagellar assembly
MYTVTFYSFKGGVGRTSALVNIAAELTSQGRRVLIVDFDLEAPGVDTFNLPRPPQHVSAEDDPLLGVVDYVTKYIETGEAPDLTHYVYQSAGIGANGGALWIMPAGKQDRTYAERLNSINWLDLYERHDGFLMFEDLKAQCEVLLDPDYVLVDSRTGHTDIAGICTRQLPDAVVALFFPNEQNVRGLERIVQGIRQEAHTERRKEIHLHFVPANVPDTYDEDQILAKRMVEVQERLGYNSVAATVHQDTGLSLINQVVFTLERPRSRLAHEYRELLRSIARENPQDREGALAFISAFLDDMRRSPRALRDRIARADPEKRLDEIRSAHPTDREILYRLGIVRERQGKAEEASILFGEAIELGYDTPEALITKAELDQRLGETALAVTEFTGALDSSDATFYNVVRAIRGLIELDQASTVSIATKRAVAALDVSEACQLSQNILSTEIKALPVGEVILMRWLDRKDLSDSQRTDLTAALMLNLMGQRRLSEAAGLFPDGIDSDQLNQRSAFNLAMALWGSTGEAPTTYFKRVVAADDQVHRPLRSPNYAQCLAIANWAVGLLDRARDNVGLARQLIISRRGPEFSAWRYLTVSTSIFLDDLKEIERLIEGEDVRPGVFGGPEPGTGGAND